MMCKVIGKEPLREFVSSSLLFLNFLIVPNVPTRPRTLHDEDYEKLNSNYTNDTAIVAHPTSTALIDQSHDIHRKISTITEFH